jgi:cell division topological specificity factor
MSFFKNLTSNKPTPKEVAKDRLKLILIHDRGEIAPEIIEKIREEILEVISKYIDIQVDDVEISVNKSDDQGENTSALIANIPIKGMRGR